jgi:radical SAM-linked protein
MRLKLTRGQAWRWTEHRDFVAAVRQALAAADLPVARGKQDAAVASAGPALPLGFVSSAEYFDAVLEAPVSPRRFRSAARACCPEACDVLWAGRISAAAPHLRAAVRALRYRIPGEANPVEAERFRAAAEWPLVQEKKGKQRTLDLKRSLSVLRVEPSCVVIEILARASGMPAPAEVMASVFGRALDPAADPPAQRVAVRLGPEPAA